MQKQSPMLRLWELGKDYHGGLIRAIFSAAVGVLCGLLPYFSAVLFSPLLRIFLKKSGKTV